MGFLKLIKIFSLILSQYVVSVEWFTRLNPNDGINFYQDKTIKIHEFSTSLKLKCFQRCVFFNSSCQFLEYTQNEKCTIYSSLDDKYSNGKKNIYLRSKKIPRIYFLNGSFFEQNQLNNISANKKIEIPHNGLSLIIPFVFQACTEIVLLDLSFNNLTEINSKSFYGMVKLTSLLMDSNQITRLDSNVFQDTPSLIHLRLNNNLIKNLGGDLFEYTTEIIHLNLGSNQIECLDKMTFRNLKKLKNLFLYSNRLKILEPIFNNLESIELLDASSNQISIVQNDTFKSLKTIRKIYIYNNQISEINSETFKGAYNLESLSISSSKVRKIYRNFSDDFRNLTILDLSRNNLSFVEPEFFNSFLRLKELYLTGCNIKTIDLSSLVNLNILCLTANMISFFSQSLDSITHLYLDKNPLVNLTFPLITSENSSLELLDISECQLKYINFDVLRNLTNLKRLRIMENPIILSNDSFDGFKSLKEVNLKKEDVQRFKSLFPNITFY